MNGGWYNIMKEIKIRLNENEIDLILNALMKIEPGEEIELAKNYGSTTGLYYRLLKYQELMGEPTPNHDLEYDIEPSY